MPYVVFPHQVNDLIKLRTALRIASDLLDSDRRIDDESLGYTLFLKGVIKARNPTGNSLQTQLEEIKLKRKEDQSPLTIARDLRRLFVLFGLIKKKNGSFSITERGEQIATTSKASPLTIEEKSAWLEGLIELVLPDDKPRFRPLLIILQVLASAPVESRLLAFTLTAKDESKEELERIVETAKRIERSKTTFAEEIANVGMSESNAKNNVKILPSMAEQLGILTRAGGKAAITPYGRNLLFQIAKQPITKSRIALKKGTRKPFFRHVTTDDDFRRQFKPEDVETAAVDYDPRDDIERAKHLRERTQEHQEVLMRLWRVLDKDWLIVQGNFDLLTVKGTVAMLFEVKTLKPGDTTDERLQIIDALGKLTFYEGFDVREILDNEERKIQKVLVFSRLPNDESHVKFLTNLGIWVLWIDGDGGLSGEETSLQSIRRLLRADASS